MPSLRAPILALLLTLFAASPDAAGKPAPSAPPGPCDDFYLSSNAGWLADHPLPEGKDHFSRWDELAAQAETRKRALLTGSGDAAAGPASRALADLVASGLDESLLDAAGQATLKPLLDRISSIHKARDLAPVVAELQAAGVDLLFDFTADRDPDNGQARGTFRPDALGLPEPAFYTNDDPAIREVAGFYRAYLADLLKYSGVAGKQLAAQTGQALSLEEQLARAMDADTPEFIQVSDLATRYPNLQLANALQAWGVAPTHVIVREPGFFRTLNKLWTKPYLPAWQAYLRARTLQSLAPTLGQDYRRAYVALVDEKLARRLPSTQAQRVAALVAYEADDLLNAAYIEQTMSPESHRQADLIGASLRAAMARAIERAKWLSADGKQAAQRQLQAVQLVIGRTPEPVDVAGLQFDRGQYAGNVLVLRRWLKRRDLARLTAAAWPAPVSQARPLVGFEAARNRVLVTAAALREPVFRGDGGAADYGALGALIGQQLSLAFARMDGVDGSAWQARTAPLLAQLNAAGINGESARMMTAADLSGLELAWDAFNAGAAPDTAARQSFFAAWAGLWARQQRGAANATDTDFAPPAIRVNGIVANLPAFAGTFSCKRKQAMNRPASAQIALWR